MIHIPLQEICHALFCSRNSLKYKIFTELSEFFLILARNLQHIGQTSLTLNINQLEKENELANS